MSYIGTMLRQMRRVVRTPLSELPRLQPTVLKEPVGMSAFKQTGYAEGATTSQAVSKDHEDHHHPSRYAKGRFEVIDVLDDWHRHLHVHPHLLNTIKYCARADEKQPLVSLLKGHWYLTRRIAVVKMQQGLPLTDKEVEVMGSRIEEWLEEYTPI